MRLCMPHCRLALLDRCAVTRCLSVWLSPRLHSFCHGFGCKRIKQVKRELQSGILAKHV